MEIFELLVSSGLVVLIWIIQLLHYPAFLFVDRKYFAQFEAFHTNRITMIVIPLMFSEVFFLVIYPRPFLVTVVAMIWLSTFMLQVPCHNKLKNGFDEVIIRKLIKSNWIRTILWTSKLIYLLAGRKW